MRIYKTIYKTIIYENNPANFNPDPIWNDGDSGFLKRSPQQEEQEDE